MRKTARTVVWEGAGAQSPAPDPIGLVATSRCARFQGRKQSPCPAASVGSGYRPHHQPGRRAYPYDHRNSSRLRPEPHRPANDCLFRNRGPRIPPAHSLDGRATAVEAQHTDGYPHGLGAVRSPRRGVVTPGGRPGACARSLANAGRVSWRKTNRARGHRSDFPAECKHS